jgi:hypothetical protein
MSSVPKCKQFSAVIICVVEETSRRSMNMESVACMFDCLGYFEAPLCSDVQARLFTCPQISKDACERAAVNFFTTF